MITAAILVVCPSLASGQSAETALNLLHAGSHQSLGLGGDPFLSPLDDQCGWWSLMSEKPGSRVKLSMNDYSPYAAAGGGERGTLYERSNGIAVERCVARGQHTLCVSTSITSPNSELAFGRDDGRLRMSSSGSTVQGLVRVVNPIPGATLQLELPLWRENARGAPSLLALGCRGTWWSAFQFQGRYAQGEHPIGGLGRLLDETIPFDLNLHLETYDYDLRFAFNQAIQLEVSTGLAHLSEIEERQEGQEDYEFMPYGRGERWQCGLFVQASSAHRFLIRQSRIRFNTDARFYLAGMQFGRLSYLRADVHSWLIAWEGQITSSTRLLGDVERAKLSGSTYGYMESWPFTSGIIDLLGIQQNVRARGEAQWTRFHVGLSRMIGSSRFEWGANWYDIEPELQMMTWQPVVFGMGWRDVHQYEFVGARAQLAAVSLGATVPLYWWEIRAELQQFVYAAAVGGLEHLTENEEPDESDLNLSKDDNVRAGTFLSLGLCYRF